MSSPISLPSLQDIFPDYIRPRQHNYSFDILRPDPDTDSLQHVAHTNSFPNRASLLSHHHHHHYSPLAITNGSTPLFKVTPPLHLTLPTPSPPSPAAYSSVITFPAASPSPTKPDSRRRATLSDNDHDHDDGFPHEKGRKHKCHICAKRFNRPSSLRIHVNTHTGATPFRCPHPTCGREFNVNSNMRRHYRNHSLPGPCHLRRSRPQPPLDQPSNTIPKDDHNDHHSWTHPRHRRPRILGPDPHYSSDSLSSSASPTTQPPPPNADRIQIFKPPYRRSGCII